MRRESEVPSARFKYSFTEIVDGKVLSGESYLYFIIEENKLNWKIWDFRVSEILGFPYSGLNKTLANIALPQLGLDH